LKNFNKRQTIDGSIIPSSVVHHPSSTRSNNPMPPTSPIRWGLIGASNIARQYMVNAINSQPDSAVTAVMSHNAAHAAQFAHDHAIANAYSSVADLLADPAVDAVYISSTNEKHHAQALAAAAAGKHILCEKPLALTLADAQEMVAAAHAANVVMGTNHHLRNAASQRTLRRLIAEGAIGTPLAVRVFHAIYLPPFLQTWRVDNPAAGGGVILDITVHDADTLRFLLDDEVVGVTAVSSSQGMASSNLSDGVMGVMQFRSGCLAQFHDAFTIAHGGTGLEIHGTTGSLIAREVMTQQPVGTITLQRNGQRQPIDWGEPEDLYSHAIRHFNQAVRGNGRPWATAKDGLRSLAIALAVQDSVTTGKYIEIGD
jgi:1,5-anhydro-D-fructose reductase (1,5-anhydro-D-mannitol-forming)